MTHPQNNQPEWEKEFEELSLPSLMEEKDNEKIKAFIRSLLLTQGKASRDAVCQEIAEGIEKMASWTLSLS